MKKSLTELLDKTEAGAKSLISSWTMLACNAENLTNEEFNREGDQLDRELEDLNCLFLELGDALHDLKFYIDDLERSANKLMNDYDFLSEHRDELDDDELETVCSGIWRSSGYVSQGLDILWDIAGSDDRQKYKDL